MKRKEGSTAVLPFLFHIKNGYAEIGISASIEKYLKINLYFRFAKQEIGYYRFAARIFF